MSPLPVPRVEVAFDTDPLTLPDAGDWTDITGYVRECHIRRGRAHELDRFQAAELDLVLDNRDRRFDPRHLTGPYVSATSYLELTLDHVSTPDAAALDITGDVDLRIALSWASQKDLDDGHLIGKYDTAGNQRSYALYMDTGGALSLLWSTAGSTTISRVSTRQLSNRADGILLRATLDVDNGASGHTVTFYTKPLVLATVLADLKSNTGWTQLGDAVVTAGTTSVHSGTALLTIGAQADGAFPINGRVYAGVVLNGIGGTVAADPDFTIHADGTGSFTDASGKLWTLQGGAAIRKPSLIAPRRRIRVHARHEDLDAPALEFDGTTGDQASRASLTGFPTTAITWEGWIVGTEAASGDNSEEVPMSIWSTTTVTLDFQLVDLGNLRVRVGSTALTTGVDVLGDRKAAGRPVHLAVTWRSSDGLVRVYVDGALRFEGTHNAGYSMTLTGPLVCGQTQTSAGGGFLSGFSLKGKLRDVRVWNVMRSAHAIHADMYRTLAGTETGLVAYYKFDEGTGTTVEDDAGANDLTITGAAWATMQQDSPRFEGFVESWRGTYNDPDATTRVKATDGLALVASMQETPSPYRQLILSQSPYLYWPLDEGSGRIADDASGNQRVGVYDLGAQHGIATPFPLGDTGRSVGLLPGVAVTAQSTDITANFERTQAFSISFFFRHRGARTTTTTMRVIDNQAAGSSRGYVVDVKDGGVSVQLISTAGSNYLERYGRMVVMDGHWHHVAFTYDGTSTVAGLKLYVDGESIEGSTVDSLSATIRSGAIAIGEPLSVITDFFETCHLAVFDSALTAAQIKAQADAAFQPGESQRADERVTRLLDHYGWPSEQRDLRRAVTTLAAVGERIGNALDHMQLVALLEASGAYVNERGSFTFDDRFTNSYDTPIFATFGDRDDEIGYSDLEPETDSLDVGAQVVTRRSPDGVEIVASEPFADARFAPTQQTIEGPWSDDNQARDTASYILERIATDRIRFGAMTAGLDEDWAVVLRVRQHRDRVTVKRRPPGGGGVLSRDCWVESISERYLPGRDATIEFGLVPDDGNRTDLFVLGRTTLAGAGLLP